MGCDGADTAAGVEVALSRLSAAMHQACIKTRKSAGITTETHVNSDLTPESPSAPLRLSVSPTKKLFPCQHVNVNSRARKKKKTRTFFLDFSRESLSASRSEEVVAAAWAARELVRYHPRRMPQTVREAVCTLYGSLVPVFAISPSFWTVAPPNERQQELVERRVPTRWAELDKNLIETMKEAAQFEIHVNVELSLVPPHQSQLRQPETPPRTDVWPPQ